MTLAATLERSSPPLLAEELQTRSVRVGVVGCGYWGPKLARVFSELPEAVLAAVADVRDERLADIRQRHPGVATTHSFHDLLAGDVDAVVVATPVHTHYHLARAALLAGKHVLVEKPLTLRADHARELTDLAAERHLTLMVGHTFVYNPAVERVREIVQSGELGSIYYLNATRVNLGLLQPDINVMWDLGPHDVSMIRFILGEDPRSVSAHGSAYLNAGRGLHEVVFMNAFFAGGVMANMRFSWLHPVKQRRLTVVGSKKMLVYDDVAEEKVVIYDKSVEVAEYSVTEAEFRASYRQGDRTPQPLQWTEPLQVECQQFISSIRTGAPTRSGGEDGLRVIKVLETAQRSLMNGGVELRIEY